MSILDDEDTSENEVENIDVPVEKRARMELPAEATYYSNVLTVLPNILLSSDENDDNTTSENSVVFDKFVVMKSI
ncbi:hypothetical protein HHI36_004814, partial [Cryptolaemus montrouzieri]